MTFTNPLRETITLSSGQTLSGVHPDGTCFGKRCPLHRPSNHGMRKWPLAFVGGHMVRIVPGVTVSERQGLLIPHYSEDPVMVVIDPDDYDFLKNGAALLRNSGFCPHCDEMIVSTSRHDFQRCGCGKSFVDGGGSYTRRTADLIDNSIAFQASETEDGR